MVNKLVFVLSLLVLLALSGQALAVLVVNEIMAYQNSEQANLEWIEIHNNSNQNLYLGLYSLGIDGSYFVMPSTGVPSNSYFIICRSLTTFEQTWGNASGTWGDDAIESYLVFQIAGIDLVENAGIVEILFGGNTHSRLIWESSGVAGTSWELIHPDSAGVLLSLDESGATPGKVNSITPLDNDLSISSMTVDLLETGESYFEIMISNIGLTAQPAGELKLYYDNDRDLIVTQADFAALFDYGATQPGDNLILTIAIDLNGVYPYIMALLPIDDRSRNNKLEVRAYGAEYPPVIITEFLADPKDELESEWVEIYNKTSSDINLKNWHIGDAVGFSLIASDNYYLPSNEYLILCQDSEEFAAYYNTDNIPNIIEPSAWKRLNDTGGDLIRIRDDAGVIMDSTTYAFTYGGNFSWGRNADGLWGRSKNIGGSPGLVNEVFLEPEGAEIKASINPNPFSPPLETAVIEIENLPGEEMKLIIYDLKGRALWSKWTNIPPFDGQIEWDGRDDDGNLVQVGMYIVYLEVVGVGSFKTTIVVAP